MAHKVRVCPQCGSTHIHEIRTSVSGWLTPASYHCKDCNYVGSVYVEVDSDELPKLQAAMRRGE